MSHYLKKTKLDIYSPSKKRLCDWSDKKNYLIQNGMLKTYVRHGMVVDNVHEIISFKQSKWLEKHLSFNTQKLNRDEIEFEKDFYKLLNNSFYGKNGNCTKLPKIRFFLKRW